MATERSGSGSGSSPHGSDSSGSDSSGRDPGGRDSNGSDPGRGGSGTTPSAASAMRRSLDLLWGTGRRATRGPKPGLTLDAIVDAAVSVADADGLAALSMRRVASELGVGTMSLYRHVPGKAELLTLMLDRIDDPSEQIALAGAHARELDWRGVLEIVARCNHQTYLRHPWLLQVNWARPVLGPNSLAGLDFVIGGLAGTGLTGQQRVTVMIALDGYVTGIARQRVLYAGAAEETGLGDDEFWAEQVPVLEQAMSSGNYPAMAALSEDAFDAGWDEIFDFGLRRLLDGLQDFVEASGRDSEPPGQAPPKQ